jgi:uncharacterized phage protein (TIGR02218 family)
VSLAEHLASGATTVCRCWDVEREDGRRLGFTDHDRDLSFDGIVYRAGTGLSARAFAQATGLAVDNSEALGALSDAGIREADIEAGRFDGARLRAWLVNWAEPEQRALRFRGTFGEITWQGGAFAVELRGLTEALNQPQGRVFGAGCDAALGDARCGVDLAAFSAEAVVRVAEGGRVLDLGPLPQAKGWYERGRLTALSGEAKGLSGRVRVDRGGDPRRVELWEALGAPVAPGDRVRIEADCDKRAETCRAKFANLVRFRGFPHIPGDDWQTAYPRAGGVNDGGSLNGGGG